MMVGERRDRCCGMGLCYDRRLARAVVVGWVGSMGVPGCGGDMCCCGMAGCGIGGYGIVRCDMDGVYWVVVDV